MKTTYSLARLARSLGIPEAPIGARGDHSPLARAAGQVSDAEVDQHAIVMAARAELAAAQRAHAKRPRHHHG